MSSSAFHLESAMSRKLTVRAARLALAWLTTTLSVAAQAATVVPVEADGQWHSFTVDARSTVDSRLNWIDTDYNSAAGDARDLSFVFSVHGPAMLRVVDFFAAGDVYNIHISSAAGDYTLRSSQVAPHDLDDASLPFANTADEAWANPADFSQLDWYLHAPGIYTVSGSLLRSVTESGIAINSTSGALSVTAVPEPGSLSMALAALGLVVFVSRRRRA
jgi:MYXO-CTERM domain-containing protein